MILIWKLIQIKQKKKKNKYMKINIEKQVIQNILKNNVKTTISKISDETNIETTYTFRNET